MISKMAPGSVIYLTTFHNGELMRRKVTLAYSNCARHLGCIGIAKLDGVT